MTRNIQKYKWFTLERIWFTNKGKSESDIIRYTRSREAIKKTVFTINDEYETVISKIKLSDEELLNKFSKTVRYEVRRCMKEDFEIKFLRANDLLNNPHYLEDFENVYRALAESTNNPDLLKDYDINKIKSYIESDCILISQAELKEITIYHIYVWGVSNSVLLFSASNFRNKKELRNLAGQLNKVLHYKDMIYFRDNGLQFYDWGNISNSMNPSGIDRFKLSFGGTIEKGYNIFVGNTIKGKILVLGKKLIAKFIK